MSQWTKRLETNLSYAEAAEMNIIISNYQSTRDSFKIIQKKKKESNNEVVQAWKSIYDLILFPLLLSKCSTNSQCLEIILPIMLTVNI